MARLSFTLLGLLFAGVLTAVPTPRASAQASAPASAPASDQASTPLMRGLDLPHLLSLPTTQFLAVVFHSSATIDALDRVHRWQDLRSRNKDRGLVVVFVVPGAAGAGCERTALEGAADRVVCDEFAIIAHSLGLEPTTQPGNAYELDPAAFLWHTSGALVAVNDDPEAIARAMVAYSTEAPGRKPAPDRARDSHASSPNLPPLLSDGARDRARSLAALRRLEPNLVAQGAAEIAAYARRMVGTHAQASNVAPTYDGTGLIRDAYPRLFHESPGASAEAMWRRGIQIFIDARDPDRTLRPGDLIFVRSELGRFLSTGLYLGEGLMLADLRIRGIHVTSIWPTATSVTTARRPLI
ncbi:MAG: hypothetical protein IPK13_24265 [Deltaproteobacteria bacterium]|nr:hypothetical protein [Deltaproteobacteria bacterium]